MTGHNPSHAAVPRSVVSPAGAPSAASVSGELSEEYDIRIARDGTWFYHGTAITRKPLVKLFSTVLRRDSAGDFWLITPAERGRIQVDDAPFVAVELTVSGHARDQELAFRTNVDDVVVAGPDHHISVMADRATQSLRPYIHVRNRLDALIARPVYYQLVELGAEETLDGEVRQYGVWSRNRFFPLGRLE